MSSPIVKDSAGSPSVKFMLNGSTSTPSSTRTRIKSPASTTRESTTMASFIHTPSGPVLTPGGGDRSSMVLLSPSRTIAESLTSLATATAQQLEEVWDEVGYSPEDRASQLSDLLIKFRALCDEKIAEERGVALTFRQTIADTKRELQTTANALKTSLDPKLLREQSGLTLQDELDSLESALEGLRETALAAKQEMKEAREVILDAHEALGISMSDKWNDVESDLTVERRDEFRSKCAEMKEEVASRTAAVISLLRGCQEFMNELAINEDSSELDKRILGSLVRSKDGSQMIATKTRTETCVGIGASVIEELTKRTADLTAEKRRRQTKLRELGCEISALWDRLHIPVEEQQAFSNSVQGLYLETIEKGEAEIQRLLEMKMKKMGELISEARETICSLWDETNATEQQRDTFPEFYVDDETQFSDELLEKHESLIDSLEERLEQMKPILKILERREMILKERMEYEELQKDSERLQKRGAAMTKQLMREEKMAKRIKRELPKLTAMLDDKLRKWKDVHGEEFLFHGRVYLDVMTEQDVEWKQYKDTEAQQKLKKKQDERAKVENRFRAGKSKHTSGPGSKRGRVLAEKNSANILS